MDAHAGFVNEDPARRDRRPVRVLGERLPETIEPVLEEEVVCVQPADGLDILRMDVAEPFDAFVDRGCLTLVRSASPERELRLARLNQLPGSVGRAGIQHGLSDSDCRATERIERVAKKAAL